MKLLKSQLKKLDKFVQLKPFYFKFQIKNYFNNLILSSLLYTIIPYSNIQFFLCPVISKLISSSFIINYNIHYLSIKIKKYRGYKFHTFLSIAIIYVILHR